MSTSPITSRYAHLYVGDCVGETVDARTKTARAWRLGALDAATILLTAAAWTGCGSSSDSSKTHDTANAGCVSGLYDWGFSSIPMVKLSAGNYVRKQVMDTSNVSFMFSNVPKGTYRLEFWNKDESNVDSSGSASVMKALSISVMGGKTTKVYYSATFGSSSLVGPWLEDGCVP